MAVRIVGTEEMAWSSPPDSWKNKASQGEPGVRFKPLEIGSGAVPRAQLIEYEAGHHEAAHSHDEDELFFLIDGDLQIGDEGAAPGSLVFIEGGTRYGPLHSDRGCRFLRLHLS